MIFVPEASTWADKHPPKVTINHPLSVSSPEAKMHDLNQRMRPFVFVFVFGTAWRSCAPQSRLVEHNARTHLIA